MCVSSCVARMGMLSYKHFFFYFYEVVQVMPHAIASHLWAKCLQCAIYNQRPNGFWQIVCIAMSTSIQIASFSFPFFSIIFESVFHNHEFEKLSVHTRQMEYTIRQLAIAIHSNSLTRSYMTKMNITFLRETFVEQLPTLLIVRSFATRFIWWLCCCNFHRVISLSFHPKQDKWLRHWRHKNNQTREMLHDKTLERTNERTPWPKLFSVWQISWHEFYIKLVLLALAKCFAFV